MPNQKARRIDPTAQRIRDICVAEGVAFAELSRRTGISTAAMQRWWNGESDPSLESVRACARALKKPVAAFVTEESDLSDGRAQANSQVIELYINGPLGQDLNEYERAQLRISRVWVPGDRTLDTREVHSLADVIRQRLREPQGGPPVLNPSGTTRGRTARR